MSPGKISILAVDDEANIRELLERGLARAGHGCVAASSAGQQPNYYSERPLPWCSWTS